MMTLTITFFYHTFMIQCARSEDESEIVEPDYTVFEAF